MKCVPFPPCACWRNTAAEKRTWITSQNICGLQVTTRNTMASTSSSSQESSVSAIIGCCHQGNPVFGRFAGTQCTAVAYIAILISVCISPIQFWNSQNISTAIEYGSLLHADVLGLQGRYFDQAPMLLHNELPRTVRLYNNMFVTADIETDTIFGMINRNNDTFNPVNIGLCFFDALQTAFAISPNLLVTIGGTTIAIIHSDNRYYLFDSHARDYMGRATPDGNAVIMNYGTINDITRYIDETYNRQLFEISPVIVPSSELLPTSNKAIVHDCDSSTSISSCNQTIDLGTNYLHNHSYSVYGDDTSWEVPNVGKQSESLSHIMAYCRDLFSSNHTYHARKGSVTNLNSVSNYGNNHPLKIRDNHTYCNTSDTDITSPYSYSIDDVHCVYQKTDAPCIADDTEEISHSDFASTLSDIQENSSQFISCPYKYGACTSSGIDSNTTDIVEMPDLSVHPNITEQLGYDSSPIISESNQTFDVQRNAQYNHSYCIYTDDTSRDVPNIVKQCESQSEMMALSMNSFRLNHTYDDSSGSVKNLDSVSSSTSNILFNIQENHTYYASSDTDVISPYPISLDEMQCVYQDSDMHINADDSEGITHSYLAATLNDIQQKSSEFYSCPLKYGVCSAIVSDSNCTVPVEMTELFSNPNITTVFSQIVIPDDGAVCPNTSNSHSTAHSPANTSTSSVSSLQLLSTVSTDNGVSGRYRAFISEQMSATCVVCFKMMYPSLAKYINFENAATLSLQISSNSILCPSCHTKCKKDIIPPQAYFYNMLDPGEIPRPLQNLWVIEKRLVSLIQAFLTIVLLPGNQMSHHGLAIHLPVDLDSQITDFFSGVCNYQSIVKVVCDRPSAQPTIIMARPAIVREALLWLKSHNQLYKDVTVPDTVYNGVVSDNVQSDILENASDVINEEVGATPINASISGSFTNQYAHLPIVASQPINLKQTHFGEAKSFPWLYPYGKGSLHENRPLRMTDTQYFQSRLHHRDSRWRKDLPYLMTALNLLEYERLCSSVQIYVRTCRTIRSNQSGRQIPPRPYSARELLNINTNSEVQSQSYMFTKSIRGTAAYWKDVLYKLLAMIQSLGPPDFFLTLSCNDNWPELQEALRLNSSTTISTVQNNPFAAANAFQRRWQGLLNHVLKGPNPPLGIIKDFFVRTEFQNRGSPHLHIFLWTSLSLDIDNARTVDIVHLINKTISSTMPSSDHDKLMHDLVSQFQVHHHSFSCTKGRQSHCRFNFPHPPCPETRLFYNADTIANRRGRFYETFRLPSDSMVNFYNPTILRYWRANMDLQLIGNIQSCAYYVFKYACKAEPEDLANSLKSMFTDNAFWSLPIKQQKFKIGIEVLRSRKIGAQEVVYRLSGMKLYSTSRSFTSINTFPPEQRYKLLRPIEERTHLPENCTNEHDLFSSNILDYYRARPNVLEDRSLYHFASHYRIVSCKSTSQHGRTTHDQLRHPYTNKYAQSRLKTIILQPTYCRVNTLLFYYTALVLYLPHRSENDLLKNYENYELAFLNQEHLLDRSSIRMHNQELTLDNAIRRIRLLQMESFPISNSNFSNTPSTSAPDYLPLQITDHRGNDTDQTQSSILLDHTNEEWHALNTMSIDPQTLESRIRQLSQDQLHIFHKITEHYKADLNESTSLHMYISGGGGTGKSFLLHVIADYIRMCHSTLANYDPVIIAAPTGVAARNVHGVTLHQAFRLPVQHGYQSALHNLSPKSLKLLQDKFKSIHTIIIDEISMISAQTFTQIHQRLCSIAQSTQPFGNYNVICFGDFLQLRPVRGHYMFTETTLWHLFIPYFLQANMRQQNDPQFINLLNAIRYGHLQPEHLQLLLKRHISNFPDIDLTPYLHIFPTIKMAQQHNTLMQNRLNPNYATHEAKHTFSPYDVQAGSTPPDDLIPADDREAGGLPRNLHLSIGTRIMLLRNLLTSQGLVNGAMGYVHDIVIQNGQITTIYIKFDDSTAGTSLQNPDRDNTIPIEIYRQEFTYMGRSIERLQFPLQPCWACTVHKTQGLTLEMACIDIGPSLFQAGQAYVALSRVRSLSNLYLINLSPSKIYANTNVINEYIRLQQIVQQASNTSTSHSKNYFPYIYLYILYKLIHIKLLCNCN